MGLVVRKMERADAEGFRACLDSVAREGRYLAKEAAPTLERIQAFVDDTVSNNLPQFVAIEDGLVVGWCDAIPYQTKSLSHRAELGMGVLKGHRGKGIGEGLVLATIEHARTIGIKRIDLEVRADNVAAIALYLKTGFREYGRKAKAIFLEGEYHDLIVMEHLDFGP